jgi:CHAD domain-containing protein
MRNMIFPVTVLQSQVDALLGQLPAVRDADVEGVHAARVATRRLREALPLFSRSYPDDVKRVKKLVKRAGRRLGRVRELDVMDEELMRRGGRMPTARHAVDAARKTLAGRRDRARRRMIKLLDRIRLDRRDQLRLRHRGDWWHPFGGPARDWTAVLWSRIDRRARDLNRAIDSAAGVYFPNRLHKVRIAAKKLRYSAELAGSGGLWPCGDAVADLKKTQEMLGKLHDAQVLLESMNGLVGDDAGDSEVRLLKDDLQGEIAERHAKYLSQRDRLRAAAGACADAADVLHVKRRPLLPVVALSAVVPAGLLLLGSRDR